MVGVMVIGINRISEQSSNSHQVCLLSLYTNNIRKGMNQSLVLAMNKIVGKTVSFSLSSETKLEKE